MATAVRTIAPAADAAREAVDAYLAANQKKSLLRFLTCGSVDDGKSTLIGRLLYDSKMLFEDQLAALESDSKKVGTQGEALDFALLVDGLAAEREQGITIDVAYRFFATDQRKFIVADTPGHEQYTRNMVTGASTADLAIILIDARKGVLTQTRRHSYLVNLLGIRHIVLAINKMDLVDYSEAQFDEIVAHYGRFAGEAGIASFVAIPISGLQGDNIAARSDAMPWYQGPALLEYLETVSVAETLVDAEPFRMAVQWVNRPNSHFRGYSGTIASGRIRPGDRIIVLPSGKTSTIARIATFSGYLDQAVAGQSVTLTFADEIDCSRGDIIATVSAPAEVVNRLDATLVWMSEEALVPHRSYWLKIGTQTLSASVDGVGHIVDVNTLGKRAGDTLGLNDIGRCEVNLDRSIAAVPYDENRQLGGFILIDKVTHSTVAAGMIQGFPNSPVRSVEQAGESGRILWLSGLSHAERVAYALRTQERLKALGQPSFVLDDANIRGGISSDLDARDEAENLRRVREVAKLMSLAGVTVLVALEVPAKEAHPGRLVDVDKAEAVPGGDWSI